MKAAVIHQYGEPEVLRIEEAPEPALRDNDVLIAVRASSVNPVDWKIRRGVQRGLIRLKMPWILGMDVSGEVIGVGPGVRGFKVGDEVFSSPTHKRPGCYAERVAVDAAAVAKKPANLSHEEAASIPLVGLTAWGCMMPRLRDRPDQRVFIQAGSGGVGTFAIQLANAYGAWVATTCSPGNHQLVRDLGADLTIDYRSQRFEEVLSEIDIVLEAIGPADRDRAFEVLRRGGRLASIASGIPAATRRWGPNLGVAAVGLSLLRFKLKGLARGIDAASVLRDSSGEQLSQIAALLERGVIRPVIDRVFPMDEVAEAHAYMETGRARGKVVLAGWN